MKNTKLKGKDLKIFYAKVFIDAVQVYEPDLQGREAILWAVQKLKDEYQWAIDRYGLHRACTDWLQGLGITIPFYNGEIIELLEQTGHYNEKTTERQLDKLVEGYWSFMASTLIYLSQRSPQWYKEGGL